MVTSASSLSLMPLTAFLRPICVIFSTFLLAFFLCRIFPARAQPHTPEGPRRLRVSFSALKAEHEKGEARFQNGGKAVSLTATFQILLFHFLFARTSLLLK